MLIWFMAGIVVGWLIEWIIDWSYWRRAVLVANGKEEVETLRQELETTRQRLTRYEERFGQDELADLHPPLVANLSSDSVLLKQEQEPPSASEQPEPMALAVNSAGPQRKGKK